jgi:hypothetical protein
LFGQHPGFPLYFEISKMLAKSYLFTSDYKKTGDEGWLIQER